MKCVAGWRLNAHPVGHLRHAYFICMFCSCSTLREETIRLISTRKATKKETGTYER